MAVRIRMLSNEKHICNLTATARSYTLYSTRLRHEMHKLSLSVGAVINVLLGLTWPHSRITRMLNCGHRGVEMSEIKVEMSGSIILLLVCHRSRKL